MIRLPVKKVELAAVQAPLLSMRKFVPMAAVAVPVLMIVLIQPTTSTEPVALRLVDAQMAAAQVVSPVVTVPMAAAVVAILRRAVPEMPQLLVAQSAAAAVQVPLVVHLVRAVTAAQAVMVVRSLP